MTEPAKDAIRILLAHTLSAGCALGVLGGCAGPEGRRAEREPADRTPGVERTQSESQAEWMARIRDTGGGAERTPVDGGRGPRNASEARSASGGEADAADDDGGADRALAEGDAGGSGAGDGAMRVVDERRGDGAAAAGGGDGGTPARMPEATRTPEQRRLDKALELYTGGDLEAAIAELEAAIATNPRFTRAYIEMSDILVEMTDYERAERVLREATRNEPRDFMAQYRHASVLYTLGRLDEARRAYLRALSVRPSSKDANLGVSTVLLEQGEPEQALPYARRAVRAAPDGARARMQLGNVLASLDRHEEAVIEYQQAADSPTGPDAGVLLNLAESLNQLGRHAEMVAALEQLVMIEPTAVAYERLGSGYFRLRRYEDALGAFREAAALKPGYYPALNGIAVTELNNYLWSGKSDGAARRRAVEAMRRSLKIERDQPRIVQLLGRYSRASQAEGR